ncbi:toprim domain-containing protein [Mycoplasmopsis gallopavonis]|uniref:Recombination protein RecR n=1 Tax=Mycoplasmopsis gallopavonis TaxID=76629 RepID=A0A449AZM1_9BACT|nr:toprim domain-containing protein [Mycoplasmopsis gallopavonis]RIV16704.1 recombination protein RecR [Mycoplasmopsis gallopavonis]VEU72934.1 recombination protein RecR [Mycoplasmopsis gallopavonis]
MFNSKTIEEFIEKARKVPGISRKQAEKIVFWILNSSEEEVFSLASSIRKVKDKITFCPTCGNAIDQGACPICSENDRDNILLVVENVAIIEKIEKAKFYYGKYFVFKDLIKNEQDIQKAQIQITNLINYAKNFEEVILGISPNIHGEITNNILKKKLQDHNIKVSQLAIGLPIGSSVDYIDDITLKLSLVNRSK